MAVVWLKQIHAGHAACYRFPINKSKNPNRDNWGKLKQILKYVCGSIYLPLIPRVDGLKILKWYVDASYATH